MNKAFEKILDRLEELIEKSYYEFTEGSHHAGIRNSAYRKVNKIIHKVAEEYNNGWIPCSERLPEEYGDYLIWWTDITGKQYYEITEYDPSNGWIGDIPQAVEGKYSVIAWQPLPEPYKESENND